MCKWVGVCVCVCATAYIWRPEIELGLDGKSLYLLSHLISPQMVSW